MNLRAALHSALGDRLRVEAQLPSLDGATDWLNSPPLTMADLQEHVVAVQFWTYTCINWLRTAPSIRAWAERYRDQGFVVIGVHTPEFSFEHDVDNIRDAARAMHVDWPIAVDSDYGVWDAFDNHYWPALYLVDAEGQIRHHHFGEGEYGQSEEIIQRLLVAAGASDVPGEAVPVEGQGIEAAADWGSLRSPENYLGYQRAENFASPEDAQPEERRSYSAPATLRLNHWALIGDWTVGGESVLLNEAGGSIVYGFHARDLHLVMAPQSRGASVRFRVLLDGAPPGAAHGADIDAEGNGTASQQRLYQLIRQPGPVRERRFEITFLDPGIQGCVFTFG